MKGDVNGYHLGRRVIDSGRNMLCMFPEKQGTNVTGVAWSGMGWVKSGVKKLGADYTEPFKLRVLLVVKVKPHGGF